MLSVVRNDYRFETSFDMKRRNRFKQTTPLAYRLRQLEQTARSMASKLPPGAERERLLNKAREAKRAIEIEQWLGNPITVDQESSVRATRRAIQERALRREPEQSQFCHGSAAPTVPTRDSVEEPADQALNAEPDTRTARCRSKRNSNFGFRHGP